jgi:predicted Zn-dependent peptidase
MEFKHRQLENGLTVIGEVNPAAQSAAVGFFVRTGSRDETPAVSGVSHFLEHMMFKGPESMTALEVNEVFDRLGAKYNAFTSEENTVYYAAVLPEYLRDVTDLWTKLMRPSLRDDDFNIEKNVILEEIAMYKDLPQFDVMDQCRSLYFDGHPCGNSVLGSVESITALTADQMREYFSRRYAPNNLTAVFCGNFDFDTVCRDLEQKCGHWRPAAVRRELSGFAGTQQSRSKQKDGLVRDHICLMSPAVSMQDPRRFAASLLGMIVGDDTGSRYFWALVDPALVEDAAMQFESMDGVGIFCSYLRCRPDKTAEVMRIVGDIFEELARNGVTEDELHAAKNKVLALLTVKSEQPMGRLVNLGFNWVYRQEYRSVRDDVEAVRAVTRRDVLDLIRDFPMQGFTRFTLGPSQTGD